MASLTEIDSRASGLGESSEARSIPVVGGSGPQPSISDTGGFIVLGSSPIVPYLSEAGDALDGLDVQLASFSGAAGSDMNALPSVSLRVNIEQLTTENEQLKKMAAEDNACMKEHLERCVQFREQMNKVHERDAMMIEEARQTTMKMKEENSTLRSCLESAQLKLENAIVEKFNLDEKRKALEAEVSKLQDSLDECRKKLDDAVQRADEMSFVHVQDSPAAADSGKEGAATADVGTTVDKAEQEKRDAEQLALINELTNERDKLKADLASAIEKADRTLTAETELLHKELYAELSALKEQLDTERTARKEAETGYEDQKSIVAQKESELEVLRSSLSNLQIAKKTEIAQVRLAYDELVKQMSLDKAAFDEQREKKIQELNARIIALENAAKEDRREITSLQQELRKREETLKEVTDDRSIVLERLSEARNEVTKLSEDVLQLKEQRDNLRVACAHIAECDRNLQLAQEREAAMNLIRNDLASQVEAFKQEWRTEQSLRQKIEKDYTELLKTWQDYEQNQGFAMVGGDSARNDNRQRSQVEEANIALVNAERARLQAQVSALQEKVNDLQAQNIGLMSERTVRTVQRAGNGTGPTTSSSTAQASETAPAATVAAAAPEASGAVHRAVFRRDTELRCPLCDTEFSDRATLIHHASFCQIDESADQPTAGTS